MRLFVGLNASAFNKSIMHVIMKGTKKHNINAEIRYTRMYIIMYAVDVDYVCLIVSWDLEKLYSFSFLKCFTYLTLNKFPFTCRLCTCISTCFKLNKTFIPFRGKNAKSERWFAIHA